MVQPICTERLFEVNRKRVFKPFNQQSLIARRVQHFTIEVETQVDFNPQNLMQLAYCSLLQYWTLSLCEYYSKLCRTKNTPVSFRQTIIARGFKMSLLMYTQAKHIRLRGSLNGSSLPFYYALDEDEAFSPLGEELDASILSDDYVQHGGIHYRPAFTGCFVGMCCQDLATHSQVADFKYFTYKENH